MGNKESSEQVGAETEQKTNKAAPAKKTKPRSNRMPGPSCYLMFSPSTGGSLYNQWSAEEVPGALAVVEPGPEVNVPAFKAKQNGGRTEIIRDINGPRWNGYYKGFSHFVKSATVYKGTVTILKHLPPAEASTSSGVTSSDFKVKVVFQKFNGDLVHAEIGKAYTVHDFYACACMGESNNKFDGVKSLSTGALFHQKDPSIYAIKLHK